MKLRTLTSAMLIAGLSTGVQADPQDPLFTEALELEERFAYSLIEAFLSLAAMYFEHTSDCDASWNADVYVSKNGTFSHAEVDDVKLVATDISDVFAPTKGSRILVTQEDNGANELGDVLVSGMTTTSSYDFYGTIAGIDGEGELDNDDFQEMIIKDFWEVDSITDGPSPPDNSFGEHIVLDFGYELIAKLGFPRAKWDQYSYLWRSNGGNGYIIIEKHIIAPDPVNNACRMTYTALVGDFAGGFQTINGTLELEEPPAP